MLNSEIKARTSAAPAGFRRDFDAHIYYQPVTRPRACALREQAEAAFQELPILIGSLIDHKAGPHPFPMFELNFARDQLKQVSAWLDENRNGLTVLIHAVTGHDERDHSEGALWLGEPLPLDASKFDPPPA